MRSRVPLPRAYVQQPGRRRVGALGDHLAGQPVADQVGDQQHPLGLVGEAVGGELIDRVERQELQAVAGIQVRERHAGVDALHARGRALVPVVERHAQHAVRPHEGVVDRPRVHRHALEPVR